MSSSVTVTVGFLGLGLGLMIGGALTPLKKSLTRAILASGLSWSRLSSSICVGVHAYAWCVCVCVHVYACMGVCVWKYGRVCVHVWACDSVLTVTTTHKVTGQERQSALHVYYS